MQKQHLKEVAFTQVLRIEIPILSKEKFRKTLISLSLKDPKQPQDSDEN
jgi:hypothetical protein